MYLQNKHYARWEVIEFGDSYKAPQEEAASEGSAKKKGRTVTTEDMYKRINDVKVRTTLLLALPDEHQLRFSKLHAIVSHLEFMDVEIKQDDLNQKFLTSLAPEWLMYTIIWRNRGDLDTMSLDDVYNHLKVFEPKVQKKSNSNSQNMAFISSANTNSGKGEVHTASVPTVSTQVSTASADVAAASISHDTICAYIASQSNGSQIKYEDIIQIDEDDTKEMNIKECRAPRSQDRGRRESYKQGSKEEEPAPKALMAIDGIGWDWSYMANKEEKHALVADDEAPIEFAFMAKSSLSSKNEVEARLVEFKTQEIKFCEKIRGLEFDVEVKNNKIKYLMNELEHVKKEKEGLDSKLTGFKSASKDLDTLLGSQRTDKNKEGLGYSAVPPSPPAQVYSPLKKDMSWTGLPEFADDTITDYSRPSPSIKSNTSDLQNSNSSIFEHKESSSSIMSKPMIKFVKVADSPTVIKTNKVETARKSSVKYAEMYRNTSKSLKVRGYWDSGCSRHMTGNISYLYEYEPYDGGYVSFGQGGGKIIGKGKDFKQKDDINVLLKTLRQHNMYSIDLNNIIPHKNLTCLVAKASADESMLWHRRLARTMLDDAKLPDTFWAEAVNTACYVQNRVLVNKSQNKTPYELFNSRTPTLAFLRPFGCHVMILNTLDHLGKFDAKGDEGYFVGYSMSSKAFRVFNKRTKRVEENLHVDFLENKLIEKGVGLNWLFDIDNLTNSMNYVSIVVAGTSSTNILGTKDVASQSVKKDVSSLRYIVVPTWFHEAHLDSSNSDAQDACNADVTKSSGNSNPTATLKIPAADQLESLTVESVIPIVSSPVPTACLDTSPETSSGSRLILKEVISQEETPSLDNILTLSNRFEDIIRVEADLSNMESNIPASPTPTFKIHKDHPKSQIIGLMDTPVQTIHKSKEMEEHSFIATIHQKTTPDFLQFCLFSCFLSHEEPKKIGDALKDPSWVEAMQEELQFKIQNVWILVDCPKGIDVKSAFLYGTIDEEVYVMQPPGFQDPEFLNRVYKVEKAMYGLHQAPRAWYGTLSKYLLNNGFQRGTIDQTLFIRKHRGDFLLVQVYIDDIIFGSSNP
nr:hypothetical protein [Tanacetum cinerariifolium]